MTMTAQDAIDRSISHNEIVTIGTSRESLTYSEASPIMADLFAACDDCADTDIRGARAEYWGTDDAGNEWRVHVWFDSTVDLSDDEIRALRDEAGTAGDLAMVACCDRALGGDTDARVTCWETISDARAQQ